MSRTANLRRHHDSAMEIAESILAALTEQVPPSPAVQELCRQSARLSGLLRIHFATEDRLLYPALVASTDPETSRTARAFEEEMGQVGPAFEAHFRRWSSPSAVQADWSGFVAATRGLFEALAIRVRRENEILYPMADAALLPPARAA